MKIINGFVIITIIFFFNSCKKEPSTGLPPGTVDTSKKSRFIFLRDWFILMVQKDFRLVEGYAAIAIL
jgi:hypothetical protein